MEFNEFVDILQHNRKQKTKMICNNSYDGNGHYFFRHTYCVCVCVNCTWSFRLNIQQALLSNYIASVAIGKVGGGGVVVNQTPLTTNMIWAQSKQSVSEKENGRQSEIQRPPPHTRIQCS